MRSDMRSAFPQLVLWCCLCALVILVVPGCGQTSRGVSASQPPVGYALKRCTGQIVPTTTEAPAEAPAAVYAGAVGGSLAAFSASDGTILWCNRFVSTAVSTSAGYGPAPIPSIVGQPLLVANVLYVCVSGGSSSNGVTYAFNASNGALRRQRQTGCWIVSIPFQDYALPILANGMLYTGKYALDPADGAVRWQMPLDATVGAVVGNTIYAYSQQTLYALTIGSGALRWHNALGATQSTSSTPVAVRNGRLYVGQTDGSGNSTLYALATSDGSVLWHVSDINDLFTASCWLRSLVLAGRTTLELMYMPPFHILP
jgi:outer membrane protein assembly factor BamB